MLRDSITEDEANDKIQSQMSQDQKIKLSDYVIDNSGTRTNTYKAADHVYDEVFRPILRRGILYHHFYPIAVISVLCLYFLWF